MTMSINASSLLRLVAIVTAALDSANAVGNVTYDVYVGGSGACPPSDIFVSTLMEPQEQEIGFCQNHGIGANLYNSIQVLGCSDKCLCFKQIAAESADVNCDESKAFVTVVKMACFDQCLSDCNGPDCGKTAQPMDPPNTRLMLTGSGPICADPVAEEDFVCEFNAMKLIDGNVIDQFKANAEEDKDEDVDDVGKTGGAGNMTSNHGIKASSFVAISLGLMAILFYL